MFVLSITHIHTHTQHLAAGGPRLGAPPPEPWPRTYRRGADTQPVPDDLWVHTRGEARVGGVTRAEQGGAHRGGALSRSRPD